ncbi:MAG: sigma-70 family RNA polymerase sigma factor [Clostridia bacterium]|nr:sigma-70 family RNA polymerase sigma factor [Clostridia bacterium]
MNDQHIVELYWQRDESALQMTAANYGAALTAVAQRILDDRAESEETVNDTYLKAWNTIPPHKPTKLGAFLAKITRELAIDRYRRRRAEKRTASQYALSLEELSECIPGGETPDEALDSKVLAQHIGAYLSTLKPTVRQAFVGRYFFALSLQEIADKQGVTLPWVKTTLHRARIGLRDYLEKEGYFV